MISNTIAAAATGLVLIGLSAGAAQAVQSADKSPKQVAEASPIRPVADTTETEEESASCNRQRRRLWIEGEGWIVRRVTVCR